MSINYRLVFSNLRGGKAWCVIFRWINLRPHSLSSFSLSRIVSCRPRTVKSMYARIMFSIYCCRLDFECKLNQLTLWLWPFQLVWDLTSIQGCKAPRIVLIWWSLGTEIIRALSSFKYYIRLWIDCPGYCLASRYFLCTLRNWIERSSKSFNKNFLNSNQEINNLPYTFVYWYQVVDGILIKILTPYNTRAISNW